jgi:hypothetical protein
VPSQPACAAQVTRLMVGGMEPMQQVPGSAPVGQPVDAVGHP